MLSFLLQWLGKLSLIQRSIQWVSEMQKENNMFWLLVMNSCGYVEMWSRSRSYSVFESRSSVRFRSGAWSILSWDMSKSWDRSRSMYMSSSWSGHSFNWRKGIWSSKRIVLVICKCGLGLFITLGLGLILILGLGLGLGMSLLLGLFVGLGLDLLGFVLLFGIITYDPKKSWFL